MRAPSAAFPPCPKSRLGNPVPRVLAITALSIVFLQGCSKAPSPMPDMNQPTSSPSPATKAEVQGAWFQEVASSSGLKFHHISGHTGRFYMPEINVGGVGLLDFDRDGLLDVYCVQGGYLDPTASTNRPTSRLYRNLGGLRFEDVTDRAGVGDPGYGNGCACGDYDGDGWTDIYVTNTGTNRLYRNKGDGTFTDATAKAGVGHVGWGVSASFFDYDRDGALDLMVANYLNWSRDREVDCFSRGVRDYCSPKAYGAPTIATLYHNRGDGTFEDVTSKTGLDQALGHGMGVVTADFDGDGWLDIFVSNDAMPNHLWMNQRNGTFREEALIRGCAVNSMGMAEAGMGIGAVDLFQRGALDLYVTHLVGEGNRLFMNTNGYFLDMVTPKGPGARSRPYTGFGVGFFDFDHDGELDLYVANGRVLLGLQDLDPRDPFAEPNTLMRGVGHGVFDEIFPQGGTDPVLLATSRGAAFGDLDNDGAVEIVVINRDGPAHLLRNLVGDRGRWALFRLCDARGRIALNAKLRLEAGGKVYWREVQPHQSYCSSNDPRVHFGLSKATQVDRVRVTWLDGSSEVFGPFPTGQIIELRQGK